MNERMNEYDYVWYDMVMYDYDMMLDMYGLCIWSSYEVIPTTILGFPNHSV
jgi:hypothetical protein